MKTFLIVKTGAAPPVIQRQFGDFDQWFVDALGAKRFDYRVVSVHDDEDLPTDINALDGVLVTGSPAMVSHRHPWSEATAEWLRGAHEHGLPMLGVCYGHQLIAHALGGKVGTNPAGRQMGSRQVDILATDDRLLGPLGPATVFQVTHLEVVLEAPPNSQVIATNAADPYHGLYFGRKSWGVQFHPEFDRDIMRAYIQARASVLSGEGIAAEPLLAAIKSAPDGARLMRRFADLVSGEAR
ncbi:MAG: glutamine amidotransferase [Wenzhouxiangella sp.]